MRKKGIDFEKFNLDEFIDECARMDIQNKKIKEMLKITIADLSRKYGVSRAWIFELKKRHRERINQRINELKKIND